MMRRISCIITEIVFFLCCLWVDTTAQINIHFTENAGNKIKISFCDSLYESFLDSSGATSVSLPHVLTPGYATLYETNRIWSLFIDPREELEIWKDVNGKLRFSGLLATTNSYLNDNFLRYLTLDYRKSEVVFISEWEKLPKKLEVYLDSAKVPNRFKELERKRLHWLVCNMLLAYPLHHSRALNLKSYHPTRSYYERLARIIKEDDSLESLNEYRLALKEWISSIAYRDCKTNNPFCRLQKELEYVGDSIKNPRLKERLADIFITRFLRFSGTAHLKEVKSLHDKMVRDSGMKARFAQIYRQYALLVKGQAAPLFCLPDINGVEKKLTDYKGSYVYIDVWASWCVPCCKEFEALKKLEQEFQSKNIRFIGISIDRDSIVWKKKVKEESLGGIQLHASENSTFKDDYKIVLIPRFVLLDPQGKIINAEMTRPSDPKTKIILQNLFEF